MVKALEHGISIQKTRSFHLRKIIESSGKHIQSWISDNEENEENKLSCQYSAKHTEDSVGESHPVETPSTSETVPAPAPVTASPAAAVGKSTSHSDKQPSDMELMKERFSKLLLGEDMSGGGKGVSSALAISNSITNLAASIFGEQTKLRPMLPDRKARWRKEIDWLLSVTDHIVEFVPSQQVSKEGVNMEIMVTRQRTDLHMDIPALRKLDAMLLETLDNFGGENEFWYVKRDPDEIDTGKNDKWWLPVVMVPPNGLSEASRRWMQCQKDSVNQVLKAAMAINAQILSEMEIPESYIESLPKNGRESLGDILYKSITEEVFDPEMFLSSVDLSTEHKVLDLKNRIEASIVIWKRKMHHKDGKSSWGSSVSMEKRELFEERAETILLLLKQQFPGISQSQLDISKIQYNKDIGQAILECYSRIMESLAFTVMSRIEDVLYADFTVQTSLESADKAETDQESVKSSDSGNDIDKTDTPNSKTLSDFMGWNLDNDNEATKEDNLDLECYHKGQNDKNACKKSPMHETLKKFSYLETLGGLRSPSDHH